MGSGHAPLLGAPLMSLLLMFENSMLVFRCCASVALGNNTTFPLGLGVELGQSCSSRLRSWHHQGLKCGHIKVRCLGLGIGVGGLDCHGVRCPAH